ncbi:MAG: hypothetical protein ACJ73D_02885 [Pyrinomonadaceae bacterium]
MRKIIWGIAAVFFVQVVFQIGMSAKRSSADYAELRTPLQHGIETPSPVLDEDALDPDIEPTEAPADEAKPLTETRTVVRYVEVPVYPAALPKPPAPAIFKPVVITYDRTGALTDTAETPEHRTSRRSEHSELDKRSLVAKVAIKPLDWLKTVGSKLH